MALVGLLLGIVGIDLNTGDGRFTFDWPTLMDGIDFVPISVGIFGLGEIIRNLRNPDYRPVSTAKLQLWPSAEDVRRAAPAALRGTALGCVVGVLPGGGATLSAFMAYVLEKKVARDPSIFGKGAIEGVAAPESANNAGAQTSFIPMLTLGIPGNAVMAVMVAALMIHGINPGPGVITEKPASGSGCCASPTVTSISRSSPSAPSAFMRLAATRMTSCSRPCSAWLATSSSHTDASRPPCCSGSCSARVSKKISSMRC
jgi:TctA family transporter